jgi:hypothetical protein
MGPVYSAQNACLAGENRANRKQDSGNFPMAGQNEAAGAAAAAALAVE